MSRSWIGRGLGLLAAVGFLLPAGEAAANAFLGIQDGNATASIGTESVVRSLGPTVMWNSGVYPTITQFFDVEVVTGQEVDLLADGVPTLTDTNAVLDPSVDKFEGTWLAQGALTGLVFDLSVTLRGTPTGSSLTELIAITNGSDVEAVLNQFVITSVDGTGPVINDPIDGNTFGFDENETEFFESVTPGWDYFQGFGFQGLTGALASWDIAPGETLLLSKIKQINVPEPSSAALLGFGLLGLLGLGLVRRRRTAVRGAALLAAAVLFGSADSAQALPALPSLAVGEYSVDFDTSQSNVLGVDWQVDDQVWIRQEFSFLDTEADPFDGNLGLGTLVDVQLVSGSEATLTFADDPSEWAWLVSMNFNLSALGPASDLAETISVINETDLEFLFTQKVIPSLGGSADGDAIDQGANIATVVDGDRSFEEVVLPFPDDATVCFPCDPSYFSFGWDIEPGEWTTIQKDKHLVPEPSTLALLGLGALVALGVRRR